AAKPCSGGVTRRQYSMEGETVAGPPNASVAGAMLEPVMSSPPHPCRSRLRAGCAVVREARAYHVRQSSVVAAAPLVHTAPCGRLQSTVGTGGVDRERPKPEVADGDREGRLEKEQIGPPGRRTHIRTPTGTDPTYGKTALNSRPSAFVTFVKVAPKQLASL